MTHSLSGAAKRTFGIAILSAALLPLGALPASAATLVHQTGSIGHTKFKDTPDKPGATCTYDGTAGTQYFDGMTLRGIKVMYPDQNSSVVDHGKVGYVIQLQHKFSGGTWTNYVTSPQVKKTAYDNAWTKFPVRNQIWMGAVQGGKFRAQVMLIWYNPNGSVKGKGYWLIDNLKRAFNGSVASTCPSRHRDF